MQGKGRIVRRRVSFETRGRGRERDRFINILHVRAALANAYDYDASAM